MAPPDEVALLLAKVQLLATSSEPGGLAPAPPRPAVFRLNVLLPTTSAPVPADLKIPPPKLVVKLDLKVQLVTISEVPLFLIAPPPPSALLPLKRQFVTESWWELRIPAPPARSWLSAPLATVRPEMLTVAVGPTEKTLFRLLIVNWLKPGPVIVILLAMLISPANKLIVAGSARLNMIVSPSADEPTASLSDPGTESAVVVTV